MRVVLAVALALAVAPAFGQEIGSEINAVTPESHPTPPPNRTDATNTTLGRTSKKKDDAAYAATGPQASAGKGMFGIHLTTTPLALPLPPASSSTASTGLFPTIPSMGFSYWLDNELSFLFDIGLGLGLANGTIYTGTRLNLGIDFHFRRFTDAIRPLITLEVEMVIPFLSNQLDMNPFPLSIKGHFGGGAEYFFSPNFAVGGKVVVGVGFHLPSGALIVSTAPIATAAWTF